MASEIIKADNLHLFLVSDGTRIDNNEYLSSLENGTELIVCTEEQIQKLLIYFELKRYLNLKNISCPLDIDYFLWYSKITLIFIEAVISGTCLVFFKVFLQIALNKQKEFETSKERAYKLFTTNNSC